MVVRSTLRLFIALFVPLACGTSEGPLLPPIGGGQVDNGDLPTPTLVCPAYTSNAYPEMAALDVAKTQTVGAIDGAFSISPTGSSRYSIPLTLPPSRRTPSLGIVFDNNAGSGILGKGFAISGLSSIHRCGSNLAQDNQIRGVDLSAMDHFCMDGARLIQMGTGKDSVGNFAEYRTTPDSFTKVVGYGVPSAGGFVPTYFVAYLPNGNIVQYGKNVNARIIWRGGVVREWQKELDIDRRGNTIRYAYASLKDGKENATTRENVIDTITYAGFIETNGVETLGNTVVDFEYDDDDRHGKVFYEGEEISRRNRLVRINTSKNGAMVLSYSFTYGEDSATNTGLLQKVDECAKGDATQCKLATSFQWQMGDKGFASHVANIPVPVKSDDDRFSWTVSDVTGDGSPDIVTSTTHPDSSVNRWFVYENVGTGSFLSPVEWFTAPFPQGFPKQWQITPVDENADGRVDLLIDQPDGAAWNRLHVLRSIAEPSPHFELVATSIPRTSQHRASEFTVDSHSGITVADVDADGMSDVITCRDLRTHYGKAEYVPNDCDKNEDCKPSLARWSAHLWRPNGFEATERHIEALDGVSCWTMKRFFGAVDWNADGQTDLVTASKNSTWQVHTLDVPSLKWESKELAMALPNALGVEVWDDPVANMVVFPLTKTRAAQMESQWEPLRAFFPDLNNDNYPDLLYVGPRGTKIKPFVVINKGRDEYSSFAWPYDAIGNNSQTFYYSPFARVFDYSGDGRDDLVLPVGGSCPGAEDATCYVVFESGRIGDAAKVIKTSIPFENQDGDSVAPQYLLRTADVNADSSVDIVHPTASGQMTMFVNQVKPNLLASITTGRNPLDANDPGFLPDVSFTYGNLVDHSARTSSWEQDSLTYISRADSANGCDYPRACVVGGKPVVASYTVNNGQNEARSFSMHYRDGRAYRHGRGFLGFDNVETRDVDTGSITRQRFDNVTFDSTFKTFPFVGFPFETRTTTPVDGVTLESATSIEREVYSTNGGKTYFVTTQSTEKLRKQDADVLERSWSIVDDVDDYGNVLQWRSGSDGVDVFHASSRDVKNDETSWLLGMVERETTCSTALSETKCRKSTAKFNGRGEAFRFDRAPNDTTAHVVSYVIRDKYGNVINMIADDDFGNHREACVTFEPTGTFPWAMRNGAGHMSHILYDHRFGLPLSTRDANGLVTKSRIDGFGRTVEQHAPDGVVTTIAASRVKDGVWTTRVKESTPGHGARETVFDSIGRTKQSRVLGPDVDTVGISAFGKNVWIVQDHRYDFLGRQQWQSIPRIEGDVIAEMKGSSFHYDNAGRPTKSITPWGTTTRLYDHDAVTSIEPGPSGIATISTKVQADPIGRAITVTDAKLGLTHNVYGPFNELRRVQLPDGTARETKQDAYGRGVFDDDPDRGKTIVEFNGFDEVVKLHDAAGRHYVFERDTLGRTVKRSEGLHVSTYEFDTAPNGIGLPARITGADGHVETIVYDSLSRPKTTTLQLADGRTFAQGQAYDAYGRVDHIEYPNVLSIVRHYDSTGTLVELTNGADRATVWKLDVVNAAGQTMLETFGNKATTERVYDDENNTLQTIFTMSGAKTLQSLRYDFDKQLNVTSRFDARQVKREVFRHDALNRVTCSHVDSCAPGDVCFDAPFPCDVDVHYDATGDITFKSDVGAYVPDPLHPHAVKSAGVKQFAHDAVGNQIDRPNETITYTDWDLPRQYIPKDGGITTTFDYSGTGQRVRRIRGESETIYLSDLYEQETNGNVVTNRFYVHNDERVVAIVERSPLGEAWSFVHADHLGSVDVISNEVGDEIDRRSFDAWGAPRDPNWGGNGPASSNVMTRRGFTWHEGDEEVGLVNAKGRIYDPKIARFLQTDPIIAHPLDAQTHNPYSYVRNRPLVMTDPSGYDAEAVSVLEYGGGDPGYIAPGQAQMVQDTQKTWLMVWPRESATTTSITLSPAAAGAPPPGLALADPSEPDVPEVPSGFAEFGAGLIVGTIVGITPFGTMVDPVRNNPQLGNHSDDYLFGKAGGEFAGGIAAMHAGIGVSGGGVGLALTGEGFMHGAAIAFAGGGITIGGGVNAANGLQQLWILMMAGGGGTTSPPAKTHGNSADSPKAQVGYEITDTKENEIVKTGISGGPRTADGGSVRANGQANQWNCQAGEPGRYKAEVVKEIPAGPGARGEALKWEKANAKRLRAEGQLKFNDKHVRP